MIYWLTGQPGAGKTTMGTWIQSSFPNKCMIIDGDDIRDIFQNKDYSEDGRRKNIEKAQTLSKFLHHKGYTVIVSLVSPFRDQREQFKTELGENIVEIYVHTNRKRQREQFKVEGYEAPDSNFFDMDTTSNNPIQSFTKLIHYLRENDKI